MFKRMKKIVSIFLLMICIGITVLTGCSKKDEGKYSYTGRPESSQGYTSEYFELICDDAENSFLESYFVYDNVLYLSVSSFCVDESSGQNWNEEKVYAIDLITSEINDVAIPERVSFISDNCFYAITEFGMAKYDIATGSMVETLEMSFPASVYDAYSVSDGYVVLGSGFVRKYDSSDNCIGTVENENLTSYISKNAVYEADDYTVVVCDTGNTCYYYALDFENNTLGLLGDSSDFAAVSLFCQGNYVCDGYSIVKFDFSNSELYKLADFNKVDIRPESKRLICPGDTIVIDDDHFVTVYEYDDGTIELQLFTYSSEITTEYSQTLTIGGYGCKEDLPLKWAVFLFNTRQNDVRAIVCDYVNEGYCFSDSSSAQAAKAELIQYFNEGNAPDIYYGPEFDYNYFGRNSMVIDLMPYLINDSEVSFDLLSDTAQNLVVNNDGHCYQLFSSYNLDGFFSYESEVDLNNLSITGIESVAPIDQKPLYRGTTYAQILDTIIRYEIPNRAYESHEHYFTIEELEDAINYSIQYGYPDAETAGNMSNYSVTPILELAIMGDAQAYSGMYNGMSFIGYPSLYSTNRVVAPKGLVSISSNCNCPDVAWEFIKCLFDIEVQRICITDWSCPVVQSVLDEYRNCLLDPASIPSEIIQYDFLRNSTALPEETVNGYFDAMSSADSVRTNDWGVFNIICEEMLTYSQGKPVSEIAESLQSRLDLYINEQYG